MLSSDHWFKWKSNADGSNTCTLQDRWLSLGAVHRLLAGGELDALLPHNFKHSDLLKFPDAEAAFELPCRYARFGHSFRILYCVEQLNVKFQSRDKYCDEFGVLLLWLAQLLPGKFEWHLPDIDAVDASFDAKARGQFLYNGVMFWLQLHDPRSWIDGLALPQPPTKMTTTPQATASSTPPTTMTTTPPQATASSTPIEQKQEQERMSDLSDLYHRAAKAIVVLDGYLLRQATPNKRNTSLGHLWNRMVAQSLAFPIEYCHCTVLSGAHRTVRRVFELLLAHSFNATTTTTTIDDADTVLSLLRLIGRMQQSDVLLLERDTLALLKRMLTTEQWDTTGQCKSAAEQILNRRFDGQQRFCMSPDCQKVVYTDVTLHKCSRCQSAKYCCRSCQEKHWIVHKARCSRTLSSADKPQRMYRQKRWQLPTHQRHW
jgi:hypothetical protein